MTTDKDNQGELGFDPETPPWLQPVTEAAEAEGGARRWWIWGLVFVVLAAFVGGMYYVWRAPTDGDQPRYIAAPKTPIKVEPSDRGGLQVAHQDKEVLNQAELEGEAATLADLPEQPVASVDEAIAKTAQHAAETTADTTLAGAQTSAGPAPSKVAAVPEKEPEPIKQQPTQPAPVRTETATAPAPKTKPISEPAKPQGTTPPERAFRIQLGAFASREGAATAWRRSVTRAQGALNGLEPSYEPVEVPERTLIRLRTGAFPTRARADALCTKLKNKSMACLVVAP